VEEKVDEQGSGGCTRIVLGKRRQIFKGNLKNRVVEALPPTPSAGRKEVSGGEREGMAHDCRRGEGMRKSQVTLAEGDSDVTLRKDWSKVPGGGVLKCESGLTKKGKKKSGIAAGDHSWLGPGEMKRGTNPDRGEKRTALGR